MFAPAATPKARVDKRNASLARILAEPGKKGRFDSQATEIVSGSPEARGRVVPVDQAKWGKTIREMQISLVREVDSK